MKRAVLTLPYLSSFCMSMYLVMQAGIPLEEGVRMLAEDEKDTQGGVTFIPNFIATWQKGRLLARP